ncbi:MAG: hypothetical protein ACLUGF_13430 [Clostridium sp.]
MEGKKIRAIGTSLILCLAAMNISGCGSKDSESSTNAVMGRVTSVSDTQIVMEVMDKQDDKKPETASGGAAGIEGINRREPHRLVCSRIMMARNRREPHRQMRRMVAKER